MNQNLLAWRPSRHLSAVASLFGDSWGDFDSLFDTVWAPRRAVENRAVAFRPRVDVEETAEAYVVTAEAAGFADDDVEVTLSDGVLRLRAEKCQETEGETPEGEGERRYHVRERAVGRFERAFRLPESVEEAAITARFENGVITLRLPKAAKAEPEVRRIEIARG